MQFLTSWPYRVHKLAQDRRTYSLQMSRAGKIHLVAEPENTSFRGAGSRTNTSRLRVPGGKKGRAARMVLISLAAGAVIFTSLSALTPRQSASSNQDFKNLDSKADSCRTKELSKGQLLTENLAAAAKLKFGGLAVIDVPDRCTSSLNSWLASRSEQGWILQKEIPPGQTRRDF